MTPAPVRPRTCSCARRIASSTAGTAGVRIRGARATGRLFELATEREGREMALAINITDIDAGENDLYVFGTVTASGNYSSGGDTLDFTTVAKQLGTSQAPVHVGVGGMTVDNYRSVQGVSPSLHTAE